MDSCSCKGPWGIGLPFDNPIWKNIIDSCPVHGLNTQATQWTYYYCVHEWQGRHLEEGATCKRCGVKESDQRHATVIWGNDTTEWTIAPVPVTTTAPIFNTSTSNQ